MLGKFMSVPQGANGSLTGGGGFPVTTCHQTHSLLHVSPANDRTHKVCFTDVTVGDHSGHPDRSNPHVLLLKGPLNAESSR